MPLVPIRGIGPFTARKVRASDNNAGTVGLLPSVIAIF